MNSLFLTFSFVVSFSFSVSAQVLEMITAKDPLPDVQSKAQLEFASDAALTNAIFINVSAMGFSLAMEPQSGKANGWFYRYYSASRDSIQYYFAIKPQLSPVQIFVIPTDTISQLLPVNVATETLYDPWVDSPQAMSGSMQGGASAFFQTYADAKVSLAFVINNLTTNPIIPFGQVWFLFYTASSDSLACLVRSETGDPIRCLSSNAPRITSIPVTLAQVGVPYLYTVQSNGTPTPTYLLSTAPGGMMIDSVTGEISWTPDAPHVGSQQVTVRAVNTNGSDEQQFVINVQPAASAPKITSTPVDEIVAGTVYQYMLSATGTPPPTYALLSPPPGMIVDPGRGIVIWNTNRGNAGIHPITVVATNTSGTDTQRYHLTVMTIPRFGVITTQLAKVGDVFSFAVPVDAFPAPRFTLKSAPNGVSIDDSTGVVTWTPTQDQVGLHTIAVEAGNKAGTQQTSFSVQVDLKTAILFPASPRIGLEAFPNPVRSAHELYLQVTIGHVTDYSIVLLDMLGRVRYRSNDFARQGTSRISLPTGNLAAGRYTVQLFSSEGSVVVPVILDR